MYTLKDIDASTVPSPSKYLSRQVLCGLCKFKCCNSPSLKVETTPQESLELQLPIVFQIDGKCQCLGDVGGCRFGSRRPVSCKLFPLQHRNGKLIVSYWSILNCPTAADYELAEETEDGKSVYSRKDVGAAKRANSSEELVVEESLSEWPTVLAMCREAVDQIWGDGAAEKIASPRKKGFGIE